MSIFVWSGLGYMGRYVTGVGKHIARMTDELAELNPGEVDLIMPKEAALPHQLAPEEYALTDLPVRRLPVSRPFAEAVWMLMDRPHLDSWAGSPDWIYCPKEVYAPVKSARMAVTVHDVYGLEPFARDHSPLRIRKWRKTLKKATERADLVLTVSEFTKSRVVELLQIPEDKIRVTGNGVDAAFFEYKTSGNNRPEPLDRPYVLSVGGLSYKKGGENQLAFAHEMQSSLPDHDFVIIGKFTDKERARASSLANVQLINRGFSDEVMVTKMAGADALICLSKYEGFGIPVLEAMAVGTPVIAAERTSLPEVAGEAAVLVDPHEPKVGVDRLRGLLKDDVFRQQLTAKGHSRAASFTWRAMAERLDAAIKEFS